MAGLRPGLYELIVTEALGARLGALDEAVKSVAALRPAEAADRIALHLATVIRRSLDDVADADRVRRGIDLARALLDATDAHLDNGRGHVDKPIADGTVLRAVLNRRPDGRPQPIEEPLVPLLDTTLLTNAPGEPRIGSQLLAEIASADRIDMVMAFIRRSGLRPLLGELRRHRDAGRPVRVLTTTYTGSTESQALDWLIDVGANVKVSYDTSSTRLHAKAWLFHRASGATTAFVGSSNLTHSAQVSGLEWNVRVSRARNPDVIDKIAAVFEGYWNSGDFVPYDRTRFQEQLPQNRDGDSASLLSPIEVRPWPFQERLLEQVTLSRSNGRHRNLLAAATGTGKTVMAAVDYARLRTTLPRARLLFVAHRMEILEQSILTFRQCLRDHAFGERWVSGSRPARFEHVFASIQSLHAAGVRNIPPRHFDVVIIDEFHHAAARSYEALLEHLEPVELLGLTATPERSDGLPVLHWFGDRIAAELRLWDAIDQQRLCPFIYYGIHDGLDLREIPWRRGRGYDVTALSERLTSDAAWARQVVQQLIAHVDNPRTIRALGFCVNVAHAEFMARLFCEAGIPSLHVTAATTDADRRRAIEELANGSVQVVFSVDLFNEGVDVPLADTLLLLRPTDSPTLFLQQLGRGLRRSAGKVACTVLDFVGQHRKEFRFDRRLRALLGGTRRDVERQVRNGFPFLPAGCHMELDPVASGIVLSSIREAIPSGWTSKVDELRQLVGRGTHVSLRDYLDETGLELEDIYGGARSWSDLCQAAGVEVLAAGPSEQVLRRACGRLLHVDDHERIEAFRTHLRPASAPPPDSVTKRSRRLVRMLVASVVGKALGKQTSLEEGLTLLWQHPQVCHEIGEVLDLLLERVDHVQQPLATRVDVPLHVHARYTRTEILAAVGIGTAARVAPWQTGVRWVPDARVDLLAFTLDKTSGQFSPTTRYRDYAINRELIHWESQSTTPADSETGLRYQRHEAMGTGVLLFARLRTSDRAFWFLGPASYVHHESERPMAVTWRLHHPLPGDLFASFAAAVA